METQVQFLLTASKCEQLYTGYFMVHLPDSKMTREFTYIATPGDKGLFTFTVLKDGAIYLAIDPVAMVQPDLVGFTPEQEIIAMCFNRSAAQLMSSLKEAPLEDEINLVLGYSDSLEYEDMELLLDGLKPMENCIHGDLVAKYTTLLTIPAQVDLTLEAFEEGDALKGTAEICTKDSPKQKVDFTWIREPQSVIELMQNGEQLIRYVEGGSLAEYQPGHRYLVALIMPGLKCIVRDESDDEVELTPIEKNGQSGQRLKVHINLESLLQQPDEPISANL